MFVHHRASTAQWDKWIVDGSESRDTKIKAATKGIADVKIVRFDKGSDPVGLEQDKKLLFVFILKGSLSLSLCDGDPEQLSEGDGLQTSGPCCTCSWFNVRHQ